MKYCWPKFESGLERFGATVLAIALFSATSPNDAMAQSKAGVDSDGDGRQEIIVRSNNGQMQVGRLVNNSLQFSFSGDPGTNFRVVGFGDFNGNQRPELVFQNTTQGTFGDVRVWPNFSNNSGEILWRQVKQVWDVQAVGDLDGDGFDDLVWRYVVKDSPDTGVSYVWFSNGSSVTQVRKRGGAPLDWQLIGAIDINGDRSADMVYLSPQNDLRILMATANRTCANFLGGSLPSGYYPLALADFTGNGRGDILIRNAAGAVQIYSLNATGISLPAYTGAPDDQNASCTASGQSIASSTFQLPTTATTSQYYASADLNGDGVQDVVWKDRNAQLIVWLMSQNGLQPTVIANAGFQLSSYFAIQNGGPSTLPATTLSAPASGAGVGQSTTLSWAALPNVSQYSIRIRDLQTGGVVRFPVSDSLFIAGVGRDVSFSITNINPSATYEWTVASCFNSVEADTQLNCPVESAPRTFSGRSPPSQTPEGVFSGFTSSGAAFSAIVLENNQIWTLFGTLDIFGGLVVQGLVQGNGTAGNGIYTSFDARSYDYLGSVRQGTVSATYVPGVNFKGTFLGERFDGLPPVDSSYLYSATPSLTSIVGAWSGAFLDGSRGSLSIGSNGAYSGSVSGCIFSGNISPRASGKNVFNVTLTFGSFPCLLPRQSASGIGITYLVTGGRRQLVLAGVDTFRNAGSVFIGLR